MSSEVIWAACPPRPCGTTQHQAAAARPCPEAPGPLGPRLRRHCVVETSMCKFRSCLPFHFSLIHFIVRGEKETLHRKYTNNIPKHAILERPRNDLMYIEMCWLRQHNIWIWLDFRFWCQILHVCTLPFLMNLLSQSFYLKNDILKKCFRESAKCKMAAQTGRTYYVFINICNLYCAFAIKASIFRVRPLFRFPWSNSYILQEVCSCVYNV